MKKTDKKSKPLGRPKLRKEPLIQVTFKADEKTLDGMLVLQKALIAAAPAGEIPSGTKSRVIRQAIIEAAERTKPQER
jgi:hypothetical protein